MKVSSTKFRWMRPLQELTSQDDQTVDGDNSNNGFKNQGCHAFYSDICFDAHISSLG